MVVDVNRFKKGKEIIQQLSSHYRSGTSNLSQDFFKPCLQYCSQYQRAVGYFSSKALTKWLEALPRLATESVKIYLLISPELSKEDKEALETAINEQHRQQLRQISIDHLIKEIVENSSQYNSSKIRELFSWMVANDHLILKFAFPEHIQQPGIFHEKIGIFQFRWGDHIAFTGSANESEHGYERNYESIDVYRSWVSGDQERVKIKQQQFEEAWSEKATGLKVLPLSAELTALIRSQAPKNKPVIAVNDGLHSPTVKEQPTPYKLQQTTASSNSQPPQYQWRHQDEAVAKFLEVRHGVLEMATGTGKTRTAINALSTLNQQGLIDGIIISTNGTDLLDQWRKEIESWAVSRPQYYRVLRHYDKYHQLREFALDPHQAILIISRQQLPTLFNCLKPDQKKRLIMIHDEVHGLGIPSLTSQLTGQHQAFGYRLGLSATPEREYDQEGTQFIFDEIGDIFYQFGLKQAIERGILCEFNYIPLSYNLTDGDRQRLRQVYAKQAKRQREGKPMTKQELWTQLARVYKTAENKPDVFAEFLTTNPRILESSIVFVEDKSYGKPILEIIHRYTHRYRTYYAEDDRHYLLDFANGKIDCLITCHRISQGIDIKNLKTVILFSSARSQLETIQRIGRCLRCDPDNPDKQATVIDFVRITEDNDSEFNADDDRSQWLSGLSNIRRIE